MITSRRRLFGIGAAFIAAPAIVRVSSLMPISTRVQWDWMSFEEGPVWIGYDEEIDSTILQLLKLMNDPRFRYDPARVLAAFSAGTQDA